MITGDANFIDDVPVDELWNTVPEEAMCNLELIRRLDLVTRVAVAGTIAIVRDDSEISRIALHLLRQYEHPEFLPRLSFGGSVERLNGRLAVTAGMLDEAPGHFEAAHNSVPRTASCTTMRGPVTIWPNC